MSQDDDGRKSSSSKDIIKELKDAAALIDAVREISKDVDENTVLNGAGNETQVTVETTLEGDLVDRAIESVQRKADNIKKLITTLIPVFLLFTGGSLEAFGVIDIFSDGDEIPDSRECNYGIDWVDWTWEDDELNVFGSLWTDCDIDSSDSLDNMVVMANAFDAESPNQEWVLGNIDLFNWYQDLNFHIELGDAPDRELDIWVDLFIQEEFDEGGTPIAQDQLVMVKKPIEIVMGCMDSEAENYDPNANQDDGSCEYPPEEIEGCTDPEADNYNDEATEDDGSCEYPPEEPCEVAITNHYRGHVADDEEQDAILISFRVLPTNCEDENLKIDMELYQNGYASNYTHYIIVEGDDESDVSHIFDNVAVGNSWIPKVTASLDGDVLEQVNFWGIDVEAQESETCEINLYEIDIQFNNTDASVGFDIDCGEQPNDLEGYNVSVQFLVYEVNTTNSGPNATGPLQWVTDTYYIQGYIDDVRFLSLDDFIDSSITHYDFYWYAIWEDSEGNPQYIERTWMNIEFESEEPIGCDDPSIFNITSLSAIFTVVNNTNIHLEWTLEHDGPSDDAFCIDWIEIEINLYKDGNPYASLTFDELGSWGVLGSATELIITPEEADILGNLPSGSYDALLKFWEDGATSPDSDVFTNAITISA